MQTVSLCGWLQGDLLELRAVILFLRNKVHSFPTAFA